MTANYNYISLTQHGGNILNLADRYISVIHQGGDHGKSLQYSVNDIVDYAILLKKNKLPEVALFELHVCDVLLQAYASSFLTKYLLLGAGVALKFWSYTSELDAVNKDRIYDDQIALGKRIYILSFLLKYAESEGVLTDYEKEKLEDCLGYHTKQIEKINVSFDKIDFLYIVAGALACGMIRYSAFYEYGKKTLYKFMNESIVKEAQAQKSPDYFVRVSDVLALLVQTDVMDEALKDKVNTYINVVKNNYRTNNLEFFEKIYQSSSAEEKTIFEYCIQQLESNENFAALCKEINTEEGDAYYRYMYRKLNYKLAMIRIAKYIDFLGIDKSKPMNILEIGPGAGYMAYACQSYGHKVWCIDVKETKTIPLFYQSQKALGLDVTYHTVQQFDKLPIFPVKFDLVVATVAHFHEIDRNNTWDERAWKYFFRDLRNYLHEESYVYFELNLFPNGLNDEKKEKKVLSLFNRLGCQYCEMNIWKGHLNCTKFLFRNMKKFTQTFPNANKKV